MNFGLTNILIAAAAAALFLVGGVILISLLLRTANLYSLQPIEVFIVGACRHDVFFVDAEGHQRTQSEGFLYNAFDPHSLSDIPKRKVLLTDHEGQIKASVDDIGFVANAFMSIVPVIFLTATLYLVASLIGIGGSGFFEKLEILANAERWSWLRLIIYALAALIILMFLVNAYYSLSFKWNAPRNLANMIPREAVKPGDIYQGEVLDTYTEEVFLERFQKNVYVDKWCIKLARVYQFPIFPLYIAKDKKNGNKMPPPATGTILKFSIGDDYRLNLL